jgi:hypothetical protein
LTGGTDVSVLSSVIAEVGRWIITFFALTGVAALCDKGLVPQALDKLHLRGIVVTFVGQNLGPLLQFQYFVCVFDELTKGVKIVFVGGLCMDDEFIGIVYHRLDVVADIEQFINLMRLS